MFMVQAGRVLHFRITPARATLSSCPVTPAHAWRPGLDYINGWTPSHSS